MVQTACFYHELAAVPLVFRHIKARAVRRGFLYGLTAHTPDSVGRLHARENHYSKRPTLPLTRETYGHIWPCSARGLPCRARCRARGALLPHLFTLTRRRYVFCGTFRPRGFWPARPIFSDGAFPCGVRKFLPKHLSKGRFSGPSNCTAAGRYNNLVPAWRGFCRESGGALKSVK